MPRRTKSKRKPEHVSQLPQVPAVYALYGGRGRNLYVAYLGITSRLRGRIQQHLVNRDSSVSTGTSAAGLNPDYVTELRWWQDKSFKKKVSREAAEVIAEEVLEPVLRSRGKVASNAERLAKEKDFRTEMVALFSRNEATGHLTLETLQDALERLAEHENRLVAIEDQLRATKQP